jgi:SH3-like domain-containing protein
MKIMFSAPPSLLLLCILLTSCGPNSRPAIQQATVNKEHASLRVRDSATSKTLRVLEPGEHVEVLEQQGRWYRVRLGDTEGWMEVSTLLTDDMRNHIQESVNSALNQTPQNTGTLTQDGNLRVDPGRNTAILRRLVARSPVEVLERKTVPRDDAPGRFDAWLKVRSSPTEVGWLLSSFVEFDVPEGIAPYTEDYSYSAVKTLEDIDDPIAGTIHWYVVGERKPGSDPDVDFTGIRVFTWNTKKQRYETAFRKQGLRGVYPLEVSKDAGKPTFRFYELDANGSREPRNFVMNGVIVREVKKS